MLAIVVPMSKRAHIDVAGALHHDRSRDRAEVQIEAEGYGMEKLAEKLGRSFWTGTRPD